MKTKHKGMKPKNKGMKKNWRYCRGDIYLANLNPFTGNEQGGTRPVVVISNNTGNFFSDILNILPLTSEIKRPNQPTHYVLKHTACLDKKSMVVAEQPKTIAKSRIIRYLGKVDPRDMECIDDCIRVQTGLDMTDSIPLFEEFP